MDPNIETLNKLKTQSSKLKTNVVWGRRPPLLILVLLKNTKAHHFYTLQIENLLYDYVKFLI